MGALSISALMAAARETSPIGVYRSRGWVTAPSQAEHLQLLIRETNLASLKNSNVSAAKQEGRFSKRPESHRAPDSPPWSSCLVLATMS